MRVSASPSDPHYVGKGNLGRYTVFLDGKEIGKVVSADDFLGEVIVYRVDLQGRAMMNAAGDDVLREVLHGEVRIVDGLAKSGAPS